MSKQPLPTKEKLVIFLPSGRRSRVPVGTSVLDAARQLGVDIESICGGRITCGKCRVLAEEGNFPKHGISSSRHHLSPPSADETDLVARMRLGDGRLACCAYVHDDVLIFVPEESRAHKQIIRKSATERAIEVEPAIRQVFVEVERAELGEHRGDWGRLQDALLEQWQLAADRIDLWALRHLQAALRQGDWQVTVTLWHEREVIDVRPGYEEGIYGLAIDIGSTTVAGYLCDLRTGAVLATESSMNPQVVFGEDLMSRVSYAMMNQNGLKKMNEAIVDAINRIGTRAAKAAGIRARMIHDTVLVGNTTMIHIVLGISPVELGSAPFALANRDPMDLRASDLGFHFHPAGKVHVLPAEAGHVGADNVGVLIAEAPHRQDEIVLTVDVGTNAEILLGNQDWMYSASSPTGPAFEGAQITFGMRAAPGAIQRVRIDPDSKLARFQVIGEERWSDTWHTHADSPEDERPAHLASGICGSGIIEAVAEMFMAGIITANGRFNTDLAGHDRVRWDGRTASYVLATGNETASGDPILVTQNDVRNIQLAKAALYAGAKVLLNKADILSVDRIVLAGAFGSYIDPKHAMILGLIPDCALDKVWAVGNAAGDGARIALLNRDKRREAQEVAHWVKYIETAVDETFQAEFVGALHLPHASDPFPHLEGFLPEALDNNGTDRPRRRKTASVKPISGN